MASWDTEIRNMSCSLSDSREWVLCPCLDHQPTGCLDVPSLRASRVPCTIRSVIVPPAPSLVLRDMTLYITYTVVQCVISRTCAFVVDIRDPPVDGDNQSWNQIPCRFPAPLQLHHGGHDIPQQLLPVTLAPVVADGRLHIRATFGESVEHHEQTAVYFVQLEILRRRRPRCPGRAALGILGLEVGVPFPAHELHEEPCTWQGESQEIVGIGRRLHSMVEEVDDGRRSLIRHVTPEVRAGDAPDRIGPLDSSEIPSA